ncbi:MAG: hypothetical protein H7Z42_17420 [Roseiflexaceae bacterium]|nr:hypothetical protein [Roseiflexaceae bacterium]
MHAQRLRFVGRSGIVGGVVWFATTMLGATVLPQITTPGTTVSAVSSTLFTLTLVLALIGFLGIGLGGALGGWFGKIVFALAVLGHGLMVIGSVLTIFGIGPLTDPQTAVSLIFLLGRLIAVVFTLLTGIAVLLARRWRGWAAFAPLLLALWPILTELVPVIVIGQPLPELFNAVWGLFVALLGLATLAQIRTPHTSLSAAVG